MSTELLSQIDDAIQQQNTAEVIDRLITELEAAGDYQHLFDALILKKRHELGLPLLQVNAVDELSDAILTEYEDAYRTSARKVGGLFLAANQIPQAWLYFRTIGEQEPVSQALEKVEYNEQAEPELTEQLISIAFYEGVNPTKGLELILKTGTMCNAVTVMEQQLHQLPRSEQRNAARLLIGELYRELQENLNAHAAQLSRAGSSGLSVHQIVEAHPEVFAEGNYHVDSSHLHSVVRFAQALQHDDPELSLARELAEYGRCLSRELQYPEQPPFEDFYDAHLAYFDVLEKQNQEAGLDYFRDKLKQAEEEHERQLCALVLVDLLGMTDRLDEAVDVARQYLANVEDQSFSFISLCQQAGRLDVLQEVAREKNDIITYTAASLQSNPVRPPAQ